MNISSMLQLALEYSRRQIEDTQFMALPIPTRGRRRTSHSGAESGEDAPQACPGGQAGWVTVRQTGGP